MERVQETIKQEEKVGKVKQEEPAAQRDSTAVKEEVVEAHVNGSGSDDVIMEVTQETIKQEDDRGLKQEESAGAAQDSTAKEEDEDAFEVVEAPAQNGSAMGSSSGPDDASAAATPSVTPRNTDGVMKPKSTAYGQPKRVLSSGNFPEPGSMLGPFFCVGRLGKGTFCSIHRCLSLESGDDQPKLVAAKVELKNFENSGVIEGESIMLQHLDESLPPKTVPKYLGLYKSDEAAAIVMELLPGEDMHYLREQGGRRRVSVKDAVYLTADVMLPLLREMHKAGVVHRDVKPSNCVRLKGKEFSLVDFGLSKSILVSKDSPHADTSHPWPQNPQQCLRKERETADFRGTSMYASLRVHQGRDYSRRDDMWSLLYVFCDLISGGLPWMSHAAVREREECRKLKELICDSPEETAQMLMGEDYHVSKFKREMAAKKEGAELPNLAVPLALSKDEKKVKLLTEAFKHVASLNYSDEPDYELLQRCLHGFLEEPVVSGDPPVEDIAWDTLDATTPKNRRTPKWKEGVPRWELEDDPDTVDQELWAEAEAEKAKAPPPQPSSMYGSSVDFSRLPVEWQYRIAQMEHAAKNPTQVEHHRALRDFMLVALPLVYSTWDTNAYERPMNVSNRDRYLREVYYKLINKCLAFARKFNNFSDRQCYYSVESSSNAAKRHKVALEMDEDKSSATSKRDMLAVSKVLSALEAARQAESRKGPPPL